MILNPKTAIKKGWITFPDKPMENNQLQPNGIDLRIRKAIKLPIHKPLKLFKDKTIPVDWYVPEGSYHGEGETVIFDRGMPYLVETFEYVKIPRGVVAYIYGRSTLNRNGVFARSSLYDSGFEDYAGFSVFPFVPVEIEIGVRLAQIVFFEGKESRTYKGQYGNQ